jgi:hypothetical protein
MEMDKKHSEHLAEVDKRLAKLDQIIASVKIPAKGDKGDMPIAGIHYKVPKDGRNGRDGETPVVDYKKVAEIAVQLIPKAKDGKDAKAPTLKEILDEVKKNLKVEHIPGLKNEIETYRSQLAGKIYGKDTSIRGGGDTVSAGSGVTITNVNGVKVITAAGGFTQLAATETPNGVLTVFTFASATAQPSFVVSDNVIMKAVTKSGKVNWTWNAGAKTATMTVAPAEDILAIV